MKGMYNLEKRVKGCLKRSMSVSLAVLVFFAINRTVSADETRLTNVENMVQGFRTRLEALENKAQPAPQAEEKLNKADFDTFKTNEFEPVKTAIEGKANSADVYGKKEADATFATKIGMQEEDEKIYNYVDEKVAEIKKESDETRDAVADMYAEIGETGKAIDGLITAIYGNKDDENVPEADRVNGLVKDLEDLATASVEETNYLRDIKADKDLGNIENITDEAKATLTTALGTGEVEIANGKLVTGGTVRTAIDTLDDKLNARINKITTGKVDVYTKEETDAKLDKKADKTEVEALTAKTNQMLENDAKLHEGLVEVAKAGEMLSNEVFKVKDKTTELSGKIDNVETSVNGLAELKADKKYVDENFVKNEKAISGNGATIAENKKAIAQNAKDIKDLRKDHNRGMAQMAAMAAVDFGNVKTRTVKVGAGLGQHSSETAVAVGVAVAPTDALMLNAKWSTSSNSVKKSTLGIGATYEFNF